MEKEQVQETYGCNCAEKIESDIMEKQPFPDKKIIKASMNKVFQLTKDNQFKTRAAITLDLTFEGVKKTKPIELAYSFCPFCGKQFENPEEETVA